MVGAHAVQRAMVGLDFFQLTCLRIESVGSAAHLQVTVLSDQADLCLIVLASAGLHQDVAGFPLKRAGCGREAQIEVTLARRELAQRTHGHGIGHAMPSAANPASRHCTWQTLTGMPCPAQYASQRIWLSCSLSPGALISTSA